VQRPVNHCHRGSGVSLDWQGNSPREKSIEPLQTARQREDVRLHYQSKRGAGVQISKLADQANILASLIPSANFEI